MNVKWQDVLEFKDLNRNIELFIEKKLINLIDSSTKTITNYNNKIKN